MGMSKKDMVELKQWEKDQEYIDDDNEGMDDDVHSVDEDKQSHSGDGLDNLNTDSEPGRYQLWKY